MNTSEAAAILRLVAAATGQLVDQYAPDAWAVILDDVAPADAKLAVRAIARRPQPHDRRLAITPDLVLAEVRRIRARRIADAEHAFEPSPAARLDPAAYIAHRRAPGPPRPRRRRPVRADRPGRRTRCAPGRGTRPQGREERVMTERMADGAGNARNRRAFRPRTTSRPVRVPRARVRP